MRCVQCQHENRDSRRFCAECGAPLDFACSDCEFVNEAGEKFCGGCGTSRTVLAPLPSMLQPAEVVEHIVSKTDGVPLYVEELTKMLLESQLLSEEADRYLLTGPLVSVSIPDTLQDSLMARLDQMGAAKEVAQLGAVMGREFAYGMLQAVCSQDEETLQAGLERLVAAELLYQRGRPPRARYVFKHALIQDAAYQSLLRSTRQHYHGRIAQILEADLPEAVEIQPELVAHHYTEAGQYEPAITYWLQAGQLAQSRSAHREAIAHLRQGIELLPHVSETLERWRQELLLYVALGSSLYTVKGFADPEVEQVHQRARALCQQLGDTQNIFPVLRGLVLFEVSRRSFKSAEALASELLELANRQSDVGAQMLGHYSLAVVSVFRGTVKDAQHHAEYVIAAHHPQDHYPLIETYGIDVGVAARSFMSLALWQLGYPDQALQHGQTAVSLAQQSAHTFSLMTAQMWLAWLHHFRREPGPAHAIVSSSNELAEEQGFALYAAFNRIWQGWALTSQGHQAEGMEVMRESMSSTLRMGAELMHPYHLAIIAEVLESQGSWDEAAACIDEALALVNTMEGYWWEPELHRLKGEILLRQPEEPISQARDCFSLALEIARSRRANSLALRAAMSMAGLYQREGRLQKAHEVLAPAYDRFTEGFDTKDLISAAKGCD